MTDASLCDAEPTGAKQPRALMTGQSQLPDGAIVSKDAWPARELRADSWRCYRCETEIPSPGDGKPPIGCVEGLGGCGREADCGHAEPVADCDICINGATRFFPAHWSREHCDLYVETELNAGQRLFRDVEANLRRHFYLKEAWQHRIVAIYILQCKVAKGLPGVFYIGLGGTKGSGKTKFQIHIVYLAKGRIYGNVSIPAFARKMQYGDNVCIDEIDESKGTEYDGIRNALLRDGYMANGPNYERWDYKKSTSESFSLYGPKVFSFRSGLEDALQTRTFVIPTVKLVGPEGAKYVNANLYPKYDDLPERLEKWGHDALVAYPVDKLEAIVNSDAFQEKVRRAVRVVGANREYELSTLALLVAEMAGVDIIDDLRAANEAMASITEPEALEQLRASVKALIKDKVGAIDADGGIRLRQSTVRLNTNNLRIQNKQKPLTDREFARYRRDLGVDDNLLRFPGNKATWVLPATLVQAILEASEDDDGS